MTEWKVQVDSNISKLLGESKDLREQLEKLKNGKYDIKLNINEEKLDSVIANLDKMLKSLGKGSGDFKQFENLSKELTSITSEVKNLGNAFGKIDGNSGAKSLLSSISSIDSSLNNLMKHITEVNADFGNIGKNANANVGQIQNEQKATEDLASATKDLADAQNKVSGNKMNLSSGSDENTLETILPTDSEFQTVIKDLDLTKSKLQEIVKITKSGHADADGKFSESFTLKDNNGSTEIYGKNSNTEKGQLLDFNYVEYNAKAAEQAEKAEQAEMQKTIKLINEKYAAREKADKAELTQRVNTAYSTLDEQVKSLQQIFKLRTDIINAESSGKDTSVLQKKLNLEREHYNVLGSELSQYEDIISQEERRSILSKEASQAELNVQKATNNANAKAAEQQYNAAVKSISQYIDAQTRLNNAQASAKGVDTNDVQNRTADLERLKSTTEEAIATLSKLTGKKLSIDDLNKVVEVIRETDVGFKDASNSAAKLNDAINNSNSSKLASLDSQIESFQKNFTKANTFAKGFDPSDVYTQYLNEYDAALNKLKEVRQSLASKKDSGLFFSETDIKNIDEAVVKVEAAQTKINNLSAGEKGSTYTQRLKLMNRMSQYLERNTRMSAEFKAELKSMMTELEYNGANANISELTGQFNKLQISVRKAGQEGKSFFSVLKEKAWYGNIAQLATMYLSFADMIRYLKEACEAVKEYDTALTEMRKVSDESVNSLKAYQEESFSTADSIGTTALDLQNATADWMRLGESLTEAKESAKDATILMNVSEFDSIDDATESLVAMSQAYTDLDKMDIIDKLNEVGKMIA
jgi:hypothetical protein